MIPAAVFASPAPTLSLLGPGGEPASHGARNVMGVSSVSRTVPAFPMASGFC